MEQQHPPTRDLRVAAVALLAVAQALVFAQVFSAVRASVVLSVASLAAIGIAVLFTRRSLLIATLAAFAGFVLLLAPLVFPATTSWGLIPTERTITALQAALAVVNDQARTVIAPAGLTQPLLMATMAAVWASAFAAHALLMRARAPFLALFPGLTLAIFTEVVLGPGERTGRMLVLFFAMLAVLFADGRSQAARLGQPQTGTRRPRMLQLTGTTGARRLAATVAAAAVGFTLLLPPGEGFSLDSGFGLESDVNPFVSIGAELRSQEITQLFQIEASRGAYWRTTTLDAFDGLSWQRSLGANDPEVPVAAGVALPQDRTNPDINALTLEQRITVLNWRGGSLPASAQVVGAFGDTIPLRYESTTGVLSATGGVADGDVITVRSEVPLPDPTQLDALGESPADPASLGPDLLARYTQLPTVFPDRVRRLAETITRGEPNAYRKLVALQTYMRSSLFTYDTDVVTPPGVDPLLYFLETSRTGFCQQFAGTFTAMARSLGHPARIAIGFQPGTRVVVDGETVSTYSVSNHDAHAWPEVFFPGVGWVGFEPTPSRTNPMAAGYSDPPALVPGVQPERPRDSSNRPRDNVPRQPVQNRRPVTGDFDATGLAPTGASQALRWTGAALLLLVVFALARRPLGHALRRAGRRRNAPEDPALAAWVRFEDQATDWGFARANRESLTAYASRMQERAPHLPALTSAATEAAYGAPPSGWVPIYPGLDPNADRALSELKTSIPRRDRFATWFRPPAAR